MIFPAKNNIKSNALLDLEHIHSTIEEIDHFFDELKLWEEERLEYKTLNSHFHHEQDVQNSKSHLVNAVSSEGIDEATLSHLPESSGTKKCSMKSDQITEELGYPGIGIIDNITKDTSNTNYSSSKYHNDELSLLIYPVDEIFDEKISKLEIDFAYNKLLRENVTNTMHSSNGNCRNTEKSIPECRSRSISMDRTHDGTENYWHKRYTDLKAEFEILSSSGCNSIDSMWAVNTLSSETSLLSTKK